MKLNERITLDKYIPYSSHIHPYVIRNRHRDLVATWELGGTVFECEDEHHLTLMATHLNNFIFTGSVKNTMMLLKPVRAYPFLMT